MASSHEQKCARAKVGRAKVQERQQVAVTAPKQEPRSEVRRRLDPAIAAVAAEYERIDQEQLLTGKRVPRQFHSLLTGWLLWCIYRGRLRPFLSLRQTRILDATAAIHSDDLDFDVHVDELGAAGTCAAIPRLPAGQPAAQVIAPSECQPQLSLPLLSQLQSGTPVLHLGASQIAAAARASDHAAAAEAAGAVKAADKTLFFLHEPLVGREGIKTRAPPGQKQLLPEVGDQAGQRRMQRMQAFSPGDISSGNPDCPGSRDLGLGLASESGPLCPPMPNPAASMREMAALQAGQPSIVEEESPVQGITPGHLLPLVPHLPRLHPLGSSLAGGAGVATRRMGLGGVDPGASSARHLVDETVRSSPQCS